MKIPIELHDSCKDVKALKQMKNLQIDKDDIFSYGILREEVPEKIGENAYDYFQTKIPLLQGLNEDFVAFDVKGGIIKNLATHDRKPKDISEIYGVALGIKYVVDNFKISIADIKNIKAPAKGKYLDFQFTKNGKLYELETKGTTQRYISEFISDIEEKKNDAKSKAHLRLGTIAQMSGKADLVKPKLTIMDDPPSSKKAKQPKPELPQYYKRILSITLDNAKYNQISKGKFTPKNFQFFGSYSYDGVEYLGEFFDRRLIRENIIHNIPRKRKTVDALFNNLTKSIKVHKFFLGVRKDLIYRFMSENFSDLDTLRQDIKPVKKRFQRVFSFGPGVIFVSSRGKADKQITEKFSEKEVRRRLGFHFNHLEGNLHECGAACRSREKEGKACEIKTTRGACHFHR